MGFQKYELLIVLILVFIGLFIKVSVDGQLKNKECDNLKEVSNGHEIKNINKICYIKYKNIWLIADDYFKQEAMRQYR